jgi:peptidoglycan-N-acetylmuramic acid deacetylase
MIEHLIEFFTKIATFRLRTGRKKWNIVTILHFLVLSQFVAIFILSATILINIFLFHRVNNINQKISRLEKSTSLPPAPNAETPVTGFKNLPIKPLLTRNYLRIEGETAANCVVILEADSQIIASAIPQNESFVFEKIPLKRGSKSVTLKAIAPDGQILALEKINLELLSPSLQYLAKNFIRGISTEKQLALTFDGDYLNNMADSILNILQDKNVPATFFLTGRFIENYPGTVQRMVDEKHVVGNHTWRHPHLTQYEQTRTHALRPEITREKVQTELTKTEELFKKVTGRSMPRLWRAPYGEHNDEIRLWAAELGYRQIGWTQDRHLKLTLDTMDWVADKNSPLYHNPAEMLERILTFEAQSESGLNGGIILMHLGSERDGDYPFEVIDTIIDELTNRGYVFVSIPQMQF